MVIGDQFADAAVIDHSSAVEKHRAGAKTFDRGHVVADEENGATAASDFAHPGHAFALKRGVANGEHFVDDQDFGA